MQPIEVVYLFKNPNEIIHRQRQIFSGVTYYKSFGGGGEFSTCTLLLLFFFALIFPSFRRQFFLA